MVFSEPILATSEPSISVTRQGAQLNIAYAGTLQSAEAVDGVWNDVTNVANPHLTGVDGVRKFFRARGLESVFSSDTVVSFSVTGPLQEHFELAFAGMPDGIFPPVREKPYFQGTLTIGQQEIPVNLRVRGNSSLQECPFPKVKFKVSRADRAGTLFFDAREVKIGTHCAEGGRGPIGRLRDERATYREALVYEAMQILGFVGPRVRRARIAYHDTTRTNGTSEVGWNVIRNAVILDDQEVIAERLGGRALDDEEISTLTNANFEVQLVTDLKFFHVLMGNWDYVLAVDGRGIWNTDVMELPDLKLLPVAGDFDLCSFVTEEVQLDVPWDYEPDLPPLIRLARYDLEQIKSQVEEDVFTKAKNRFETKRDALELKINAAMVDEAGRTNALGHVSAFFDALAALTIRN